MTYSFQTAKKKKERNTKIEKTFAVQFARQHFPKTPKKVILMAGTTIFSAASAVKFVLWCCMDASSGHTLPPNRRNQGHSIWERGEKRLDKASLAGDYSEHSWNSTFGNTLQILYSDIWVSKDHSSMNISFLNSTQLWSANWMLQFLKYSWFSFAKVHCNSY